MFCEALPVVGSTVRLNLNFSVPFKLTTIVELPVAFTGSSIAIVLLESTLVSVAVTLNPVPYLDTVKLALGVTLP